MKFDCKCGTTIRDQTDSLPNKARLIADQDWGKFHETMKEPWQFDHSLVRVCFQCHVCGRLWIEDPEYELKSFAPEEAASGVLSESKK